jgi:hypothetical protein
LVDTVVCLTDPSLEGAPTVDHDIPTPLLDVANVQVNRVIDELRRIAASGRLVTVEDIAMMLLAAELKNVDRQRELLAVLLAITLQRLAWR